MTVNEMAQELKKLQDTGYGEAVICNTAIGYFGDRYFTEKNKLNIGNLITLEDEFCNPQYFKYENGVELGDTDGKIIKIEKAVLFE